ncbi:MAG TPA: hypothetical protein VEG62_08055, partial [Acidimicrobiales bacterium]|nr:hypothetical protein [Acidimicrobiales bacterium]
PAVTCTGNTVLVGLVAGVAQCTTTGLTAALPQYVTAEYLGDATDAASLSAQLVQTVTQASTSVSVTSSGVHTPFSLAGCDTTAGSAVATCPSVGAAQVGASVTDGGVAIPAGTTVLAVSTSPAMLTLSNAATLTESGDTFVLVNDPDNALASGAKATFTATLAPTAPATGFPTGTFTWTLSGADGSTPVCASGSVVGVSHSLIGVCKVPQGVLRAAGSPYTVSVSYSGDSSYSGSSGNFSQIMNPGSTKTFVTGTRVPVEPGAAVDFTAAVTPKGAIAPTGSVTFTFTALPFKVGGCTVSSTSAVVNCATGSLSGVVAGYTVSDLTTPAAIASGTTVLSLGTRFGTATLSATPSSSLTGQQLEFVPAGSGIPTLSCSGGDTLPYVTTGTTCSVSAPGFPSANAEWGVVVSYSGDAENSASTSKQLKLKTL